MAEEFEIRRDNRLLATPEQIWEAVATGPGNLGWLYPMEIEPWEGGTVSRGPATVTVWDRPWRFACRHDSEDGLSVVLEYRIEAYDEGGSMLRAVIRRVHSGVVGADWKTHTDAADKHTDFYHHTLGQYLQYFNGQPAAYVQAQGPETSTQPNAFAVLRRGLGISDHLTQGETARITPSGLDPLDAVVDYLSPQFIGLRTADGLYRFFGGNAWGWPVGLSHHLFADNIDQQMIEHAWRGWLNEVFV